MATPLMPKATAVWLVDNTILTFQQIGDFCGLHALEVKGIADGDVAQGIQGLDPITSGQLTREELDRCAEDPEASLEIVISDIDLPELKQRGGRYTPLSRRQDRPNAIAWLIRNHPELSDAQITKLVGTTKPTILTVRERTHWNMPNIKPVDPVTLGLCRQIELDGAVQKARAKEERLREKAEKETKKAQAEQLAAAEAAGMPSTQPVPEAAPAIDAGEPQPNIPESFADLSSGSDAPANAAPPAPAEDDSTDPFQRN